MTSRNIREPRDRAQIARRGALVAIGLFLACLAAAAVALLARPLRITSHEAQIAYALRQHNIAYRQINLRHTWPDTLNTDAYAADVEVLLANTGKVNGRIECRSERQRCVLTIRTLGITREALPELSDPRSWSWLDRTLDTIARLIERTPFAPILGG